MLIKQNIEMRRSIRILFLLCAWLLASSVVAQTAKWQDLYKVKKKDTIYGIAHKYNITIEELMQANPDMQKPDYVLKKGEQLLIPFSKQTPNAAQKPTAPTSTATRQRVANTVNVGVMLPLHNVDGDGQRMIEYYRGVLMACDSLRSQGINTNIFAWNLYKDADVSPMLADANAKNCDLIFGPLYTKQVKPIADFCRKHGIRLVIPFSINGGDVETNDHIFQVYQSRILTAELSANAFMNRFKDAHPVFVDCNDSTSDKGIFTSELRKRLEAAGLSYNITNLKSSLEMFAKAFSAVKQNVVILNTGRSPQLNSTLAKLNVLRATFPNVRIALFGYNEWLMYKRVYQDYYYKYEAYIPTAYIYNEYAPATANLERSYRQWFKSDMRQALPRFALTGYDQAQFFIRGINKYGAKFEGTHQQNTYTPLQTPLKFKRVSNGGMQNNSFILLHYKPNRTIETISY